MVPIGLADTYAMSTLSVPYQGLGVRLAYILAGDCGGTMAESWPNCDARSRFVDLTFASAKRSFVLSPLPATHREPKAHPMATSRTTPDADWRSFDTANLPLGLAAAYDDYKAAQRKASALRDEFEAAFTEMSELPAGQRLLFGYRFGKLSIAVVTGSVPAPRKPAAQPLDLAAVRDLARSRATP